MKEIEERKNNYYNELEEDEEEDPVLEEIEKLLINIDEISAQFVQRRFKIGYNRASKIVDQLESKELISGYSGSHTRQGLHRENYKKLEVKNEDIKRNVEKEKNQKDNIFNKWWFWILTIIFIMIIIGNM